MLLYTPRDLSEDSNRALSRLCDRVMEKDGRVARYAVATTAFSAKRPAFAFSEIRDSLGSVAPNIEACYYCERDRNRDIDHIFPKSIYPDMAFNWENYAYSCAICNQDAKRSKYGIVLPDGRLINLNYITGTNDDLPDGVPAFINPRSESGLDFFHLDLETGIFLIRSDIDIVSRARAKFTRETLDLNSDGLTRSRRQAFVAFVRYIRALLSAIEDNDLAMVSAFRDEVADLAFPTVMVETWRQRQILGDLGISISRLREYLSLNRWNGADLAAQ